ncbi:MAG TPA: hypothetical protein VKB90_09860 [Candidatus Acidoferrum sp.]|nr:hypothetical protein [Candidatus Acidoferrum sp.]
MTELDARADRSGYLALGSIFFALTLFGLYVAIRTPAHDWNFVYVPAGMLALVLIWLRSIRLRVANGELSYRTLFGARRVNLSDIEKAEMRLLRTGKGPYRVLFIYPRTEEMQKPMRINIKVFFRTDLSRLFDLLGPKLQGPRGIGVYSDEEA